jgi:glucose/arabinose dehydrogenase
VRKAGLGRAERTAPGWWAAVVSAAVLAPASLAAAVLAAEVLLAGCGGGTPSHPSRLALVAGGLANPRQMSFGADGALYVAEAGSGGHGRCAKDPSTTQQICVGSSGAVARVAHGVTRRVITGLPSVAGASGQESSGPADVVAGNGRLAFVTQDTRTDHAGANQFGEAGRLLGRLLTAPIGRTPARGTDLARFEAEHNPDHGRGAVAADALESDPYALASYRGGYAVADAAANDVLWVSPAGGIRVLAVLPIQHEIAPPGSVAKAARRVAVQAVPTSVAAGPDGALYVSELTGSPFDPGYARIWRVVPGQRPTVFARGFTNVSAIAFDRAGRLLVLEIDRSGLRDVKAPGALIRVDRAGHRTLLASSGLSSPTGVAVAADGSIYVANHGTSPATGPGAHGEIVRVLTR